jgi:hypothetical protein
VASRRASSQAVASTSTSLVEAAGVLQRLAVRLNLLGGHGQRLDKRLEGRRVATLGQALARAFQGGAVGGLVALCTLHGLAHGRQFAAQGLAGVLDLLLQAAAGQVVGGQLLADGPR